ncbi:MAG TPA: hypothetical protein VMT89_07840 [Candidatus Acidoferrales bacterium]|nr:hypothetical protein [Candidatus Acidoferrales bacterium]
MFVRSIRFLTAQLIALSFALSANALVVVQRDFADLVARAEQIVIGTVVDIKLGQNALGSPVTLVTVGDLSVLKGSVGNEMTLQIYGGGNTHIADLPEFKEGDRAVLFVAGNGRDVCPLVGVGQGRFRVRFDAQRNEDVVDTNDGRMVVGREKRSLRFAPASTASANALSVDEFRQMISDELASPSQATGQ